MTRRLSAFKMKSARARTSTWVAGGLSGAVEGRRLPHPAEVAKEMVAPNFEADVDVLVSVAPRRFCCRCRRWKQRCGANADDDNDDDIIAIIATARLPR